MREDERRPRKPPKPRARGDDVGGRGGIPRPRASGGAARRPLPRREVHSGPLRFAELDSFVDGVLGGGPLQGSITHTRAEYG